MRPSILFPLFAPITSLKGRPDLAYGFSADQRRRAQTEHGNVSTIAKREGWSHR